MGLSSLLRSPATWLLGLLFIGAFWLNQHTPTWGDDWHRTLPVSFGTLFERLSWEYQTWTGRLSVLLLTYLLFWDIPGHWTLFSLLNSLALVGLITSLARFARPASGTPLSARLVFCAVLAVWFGTHAFGEAVLWKTGAIAFLWPSLAALWLIRPFVERFAGETPRTHDSAWQRWALPWAYAFVALSLENLSVAMLALMVLSIATTLWRRQSLPLSAWTALGGHLLGTAALLLAPGNWARFQMQDDGLPLQARLPALAIHIVRHFSEVVPWLPLLAGLFLLALCLGENQALRRAWAWLIFATLTGLAMAGSTGINFSARTAFVTEIFVGFSALILVAALLPRADALRVQAPLLILGTVLWGADALKLTEQTLVVSQQTDRRAELMTDYRAAGLDRILLPSIAVPYLHGLTDDHARGRFFLRDIHDDRPDNGWRNGTYAEDHGFAFATRLPRTALIFEPELHMPARFQPLPAPTSGHLLIRRESHGRAEIQTLYWLSPPPCATVELRYQLGRHELRKALPGDRLAYITTEGSWARHACTALGLIPPDAVNVAVTIGGHEVSIPTE